MQDILLFIQHHFFLFMLLAIILVGLFVLESIKLKHSANRLAPSRVIQLMNHHKAIVIDIRSADAFSTGSLVGAISLPFSEIKDKLKKIEKFKSQPIVIVCANGADSPKAATFLVQQGFNAQVLSGGIRAWHEAQLPLVKN